MPDHGNGLIDNDNYFNGARDFFGQTESSCPGAKLWSWNLSSSYLHRLRRPGKTDPKTDGGGGVFYCFKLARFQLILP